MNTENYPDNIQKILKEKGVSFYEICIRIEKATTEKKLNYTEEDYATLSDEDIEMLLPIHEIDIEKLHFKVKLTRNELHELLSFFFLKIYNKNFYFDERDIGTINKLFFYPKTMKFDLNLIECDILLSPNNFLLIISTILVFFIIYCIGFCIHLFL